MAKGLVKICIVALLVVGFGSVPAQAIPTVSLHVVESAIAVGESFAVQVFVDGDNIGLDLLAFGFDVHTTGSVLTYDSYMIATGFDDDSPVVPPAVAGSAFPGIAEDDVLLTTLRLTATDVGTGSVQVLGLTDNVFVGLAYEIDPITISWYDIDASLDIIINAGPVASVPEPSTMLLIGTGLVALVWRRRKRQTLVVYLRRAEN